MLGAVLGWGRREDGSGQCWGLSRVVGGGVSCEL